MLALTRVREHYHPINRQWKQDVCTALLASVARRVDAATSASDFLDCPSEQRAQLHCLHGRALDLSSDDFDAAAESALSRAIRLDSGQGAAWAALGHCLFKKRDLEGAVRCLTAASEKAPSCDTYALWSMALRQQAPTSASAAPGRPTAGAAAKSQLDIVKESIAVAKKAVAADMGSPTGWTSLATAHLSAFFAGSREMSDLERAAAAYTRAVALEDARNTPPIADAVTASTAYDAGVMDAIAFAQQVPLRSPDLHYNRAECLCFTEEYEAAIASYERAGSIDPSLPWEAGRDAVQKQLQRMLDAATHVNASRARRQGELALQLASFDAHADVSKAAGEVKKVASSTKAALLRDGADLSPAEMDVVVAAVRERAPRTIAELTHGANPSCYIALKVVQAIPKSDRPPACFLAIDKAGGLVFVSSHHMSEDALATWADRRTVVIIDPAFKATSVRSNADAAPTTLHMIHVMKAATLLVDGKPWASSFNRAGLSVSSFDR